MHENAMVRFSVLGRTNILVSGEVKFIQIFAGVTCSEGIKVRHSPVASEYLTNNRP